MSADDRIPLEGQRCECPCGCTELATTWGEAAERWLCDDCAGIVPERAADGQRGERR